MTLNKLEKLRLKHDLDGIETMVRLGKVGKPALRAG